MSTGCGFSHWKTAAITDTFGRMARFKNSKPTVHRDTVMISHANPEDNEFTLWLHLQLTKDGYKVWSDLTNLIGGEQFWTDIEQVIRTRAVKFIFVLSRASNESNRGFRRELHLADSEARRIAQRHPRFIIPIAIDDLPSSDYNIYVQQLDCIRSQDWSHGLAELLKRLRKDKVPRFPRNFNPTVTSEWWRRYRSAKAGVTRKPDRYLSNWFPITSMPQKLYWHGLETIDGSKQVLDFEMPFTFVQKGEFVFTFATEAEVRANMGSNLRIISTDSLETQTVINEPPRTDRSGPDFKRLLVELLRTAWDSWIERQGVGIHGMANNRRCAFFKPQEGLEPLRGDFMGVDGKPAYRNLTGIFTRGRTPEQKTTHYWHYGLSVKTYLWPYLVFHISAHVLFSDNGKQIWESKKRLHSARRRQCKSWYNDAWRDRLLAAMAYLTAGKTQIEIPVTETVCISVSPTPIQFDSKITCEPVIRVENPEEGTGDEDDEDEGSVEDKF
jgi:hypothetical protein